MKNKGQTLIETMVTLLFIAMGVLALIRFQNYLGYDTSVIQQRGTANIIALSTVETLRDFQVQNTTSGYTAYQNIVSGSSTVTNTGTAYTVTWTVTAYTNPTYKNLNVLVSWTDRVGTTQSVREITNVAGIEPKNSADII